MTATTAIDNEPSSTSSAPLRPPEQVMRLKRMGAAFPTRLSFMRTLIRTLARERATVTRPIWQIDDTGYGHAVYTVPLGGYTYSLVAISTPLDPENRTDRVIAEAWDTTYVLFDGVPDNNDIERIRHTAPLQEAGRFTERDLILSRANKSVRLFEHVVDSLADGHQPDINMIRQIGYLMRTTAVYGNGKFGIADRACIGTRPGLGGPFSAEMLLVWLIRGFTHDLVEHIAHRRNPETFVPLAPNIRRYLGIGNATGLGMAPFLVSHPILFHNWMAARETAIARVRAQSSATPETIAKTTALFSRASNHLEQWNVDDTEQMQRILTLRDEMRTLAKKLNHSFWIAPAPWDRLIRLTADTSLECQELIASLILEPHGDLIDTFETTMSSDISPKLHPTMRLRELTGHIENIFHFAVNTDFTTKHETEQFWYVSEEKLEPRLGNRYEEDGAELEMPLDIARQVQALHRDLVNSPQDETVAEFLLCHPHHRYAITRVQTVGQHPYSEIRDNLIATTCLPIDMLRCKLAFFGAAKFDPRSDRWTRITLYQGAPSFDGLNDNAADDWWLPVLETT